MRFSGLYLLLALACANPSEGEKVAESPGPLRLVPVDTIEIPFIGKPIVQDIHPGARRILFMDQREYGEEIFVADFEGNILHTYSKFGDVPDRYGVLMAPLTFVDENHFLAYGFVGFNTYELSGKLVTSVREDRMEPHTFAHRVFGRSFAKHGDRLLYFGQGTRNRDGPFAYEDMYLLKWLTPPTGQKEVFGQFPEGSMFRTGKYFPMGSWWPAFCIADGYIYVAYGIEPVVYMYEAEPPYGLVSQLELTLQDYHYFRGGDSPDYESRIELFMSGGKIENIIRFKEFLLIAYYPGYSPADLEKFQEDMDQEERIALLERMEAKYKRRIWVGDLEGNKLGDFVPELFQANIIGVRDGELYGVGLDNVEEEEDLFRIYRLDIMPTSSEYSGE